MSILLDRCLDGSSASCTTAPGVSVVFAALIAGMQPAKLHLMQEATQDCVFLALSERRQHANDCLRLSHVSSKDAS